MLGTDVKSMFPFAEYIDAKDPDIEDDIIYLTDNMHIQVGCNTFYLVYHEGFIFEYVFSSKELLEVVKVAVDGVALKFDQLTMN